MPNPNDNIEKLETPDPGSIKSTGTPKRKRKKGDNRVARWFREMRSELKKVVWPTPKQIVNNTSIVLSIMVVAAIAIWALDYASSSIFQAIITFIPRLIRG